MLHYRSRDNSILREHLLKSELKYKYTSPDIQNEIIQICGEMIADEICRTVTNAHVLDSSLMRLQIVQQLNKSLYAFVFFDNSQGIIREEFIGFAECRVFFKISEQRVF